MDIGQLLEKHPSLEDLCRQQISLIHKEIVGADPLEEVQDYVLTIGVKNNSSRTTVMQDFQVLFNEKTEELVRWLFENLAPRIKLEAAKIEKSLKPQQTQELASSDLVDAFNGQDDEFDKPRRDRFQKPYGSNRTDYNSNAKSFSSDKRRSSQLLQSG